MLSKQNLAKLNRLVRDHGGEEKAALLQAIKDLQTAIAGQALLVHKQNRKLLNLRVNARAMNRIMSQNTLTASLSRVGRAKQNTFTMADVQAETKALADKVANATNFNSILTNVIGVAKLFL